MMQRPKLHFFKKKNIFFFISALVLLLIGSIVLQILIKNKIKKTLSEDLPSDIHLVYEDLDFNLFFGDVGLKNLKVSVTEALDTITTATIKELLVKDISYSKMLWNGNFEVDDLIFDTIDATYFFKKDTLKKPSAGNRKPFHKVINIQNFEIKNLNFIQKTLKKDSLLSQVTDLNLKIKNCKIDSVTLASKIPFEYDAYMLRSGKLFYNSNAYEVMGIDSLSIDKSAFIHGFSLKTKYKKEEFDRKLNKERDYIDLKIPEIELKELDFGFQNDTFFIAILSGKMKNLNLEMYRNKLLPDDLVHKPMFLETLYKLPIAITIPTLELESGRVSYSELVKENTRPGEVFFTEINSVITNMSNTTAKEIVFKNKAKLMGIAPIDLEWSFYTKKEHNLFKAFGVIKDFETKSINMFLKSNLRAEARGSINELYFTISGDEYTSSGDMKMKYNDFGFVVLQKDRSGVNKLLTAIGNIFTNDGSKTDENGYRYGEIKVERNPTKSFFNYLWINVKDGILSTFTSNGKKKDK